MVILEQIVQNRRVLATLGFSKRGSRAELSVEMWYDCYPSAVGIF